MNENVSKKIGYTYSHMSEDQGGRYQDMYAEPYYRYHWDFIEKEKILSLFQNERQRGAETYLDFACGTGRVLKVGEEVFKDSTGYDISASMIAECQKTCKKSRIELIDITKNKVKKKFDVISAFRFFLNAEPELRMTILEHLHEILADDGRLIANIHTTPNSPRGLAYRLRNWLGGTVSPVMSFQEFQLTLELANFEVIDVHYYGYFPRTIGIFDRLAKFLLLPAEKLGRMTAPKSNVVAQSFVVVCKKKTEE